MVGGSIEDQTRLTLSHIGKVLEAAGCSFENAVKSICHLSDIPGFDSFNSVYAQFSRDVRQPAWMNSKARRIGKSRATL